MQQLVNITTRREADAVTLTPAAVNKLRSLLNEEQEDGMALRMAVQSGGCSGFSYDMFFDADIADNDIVSDFGGVSVVVDTHSLPLLRGAVLDYQDGLMDSGFRIENPNVTRSCGCGNSFS